MRILGGKIKRENRKPGTEKAIPGKGKKKTTETGKGRPGKSKKTRLPSR
jgi:hypothetical protein